MQTICITGGTGFLGKHLVSKLSKQEHVTLRILTRDHTLESKDNIEYIYGDLLNKKTLSQFIVKNAIVINLVYLDEPLFVHNKLALTYLTDICKAQDVKHFIHISTAMVAGRVNAPEITESTTCHPITAYELNKYNCELLLKKVLYNNIPLTILRPTAIFGSDGKNINKLINDFLTDTPTMRAIKLSLYHKRVLHLVPVSYVVSAIEFILTHIPDKANSQCFIVSNDKHPRNTYFDLIQIISKYSEVKIHPFFFIPFPFCILSLLLRLKGVSQIDPTQVYIDNKLQHLGFPKNNDFEDHLLKKITHYLQIRELAL